jgi:formiminotetrahydrofolate cyclodeaminase
MTDLENGVTAFRRVLDPADNSTGGGTASAVAGAMAAALVAMVARLSIGKPNLKLDAEFPALAAEAERLSAELLAGSHADSAAFEALRAAFRLPKGTTEERAERSAAIQAATAHAARVPLANAGHCARVRQLADHLKGRSNPNAASDLACASYLARAGLLGCVENVRINTPALKDGDLVDELNQRAGELLASAAAESQG